MEMHNDAMQLFKGLNLTEFNLTDHHWKVFLKQMLSQIDKYEYDPCDEYCNGSLRDALTGYTKSFHGYVSLVVSVLLRNS